MGKWNYYIFVFLWLALFSIVIFTFKLHPSFFITEEKAAQLKDVNFHIPSPASYEALFRVLKDQQASDSDLQDVMAYYKRIIIWAPDMADAYAMLGFCYYYKGDLAQALENYGKAAQLSPDNFWNYYDIAIILYKKGAFEASKEFMMQALAINPKDTLGHVYSSKVFRDIMESVSFPIAGRFVQDTQEAYQEAAIFTQLSKGNKQEAINAMEVRFF